MPKKGSDLNSDTVAGTVLAQVLWKTAGKFPVRLRPIHNAISLPGTHTQEKYINVPTNRPYQMVTAALCLSQTVPNRK